MRLVDLVMLQSISYVAAAIGVCIAAIYYILTLRTTQKSIKTTLETRQAQLFMQLYDRFNSKEFTEEYAEIVYQWRWQDYDDWVRKYGPDQNTASYAMYHSVFGFFEGVGMLVKRKLIDISYVENLMSTFILYLWEKMGPLIKERRERINRPRSWEWVEYLYNEMTKYEKQLGLPINR